MFNFKPCLAFFIGKKRLFWPLQGDFGVLAAGAMFKVILSPQASGVVGNGQFRVGGTIWRWFGTILGL